MSVSNTFILAVFCCHLLLVHAKALEDSTKEAADENDVPAFAEGKFTRSLENDPQYWKGRFSDIVGELSDIA